MTKKTTKTTKVIEVSVADQIRQIQDTMNTIAPDKARRDEFFELKAKRNELRLTLVSE